MDTRPAENPADDRLSGAEDKWSLSAREAASQLGLSERTIRRAISRGDLAARKRAGVYQIERQDIDSYRERVQRSGSPGPNASGGLLHLIPFTGRIDSPATLPHPLTPLIGREQEIAFATARLRGDGAAQSTRLLTLTGPGGVGKTRVAVQVAEEVAADFPGGVWFVSLAPISSPTLVASAIAHVLTVREVAGEPLASRIAKFLAGKRTLLVLDNFEQVVEAAPLVTDLLERCPLLAILVTSRTRLRVSGELEQIVSPLATTELAAGEIITESNLSAAERLFAARAGAVRQDFVLTEENVRSVTDICRRLDGLPLAIELAAALVKVLPPASLLERLERRLPLLTSGGRDLPARQQTMRDTIAWSYDLLTADEQALFRRVAIFVGGFTLEAAEAIAGDLEVSVLDGIASLIDKSLLRAVASETGAARYTMLETVREYCLEQLDKMGETKTVRACHAAWVAAFAERSGDLLGPVSINTLAQLAAEHDNARAALGWAIDAGANETGLRIATAFFKVWHIRGFYSEGRRWLGELLALGQPTPIEHRAAALFELGWFALLQGDLHAAEATFSQVLSLAQVEAVGPAEGHALSVLGICAMDRGDFATAEARQHQALALARRREDDHLIIGVLCNLGVVASSRGDLTLASRYFAESLELDRQADDPWSMAITLGNVGWVARKQGDFRRAAAVDRERLAINLLLANREQQGDCCQIAAEVAIRLGQSEQAARLAGVAARVRDELGFHSDPAYQREVDATEVAIRAGLDDAVFQREWVAGQATALEAAVLEADAVFAEEEAAPEPASPQLNPAALNGLTPRETEVLRLLAQDWSNQQIADHLFLSRRTVHKHVENILGKLGVESRAGAAVWAVRHEVD